MVMPHFFRLRLSNRGLILRRSIVEEANRTESDHERIAKEMRADQSFRGYFRLILSRRESHCSPSADAGGLMSAG